jgi:hypothetical protein
MQRMHDENTQDDDLITEELSLNADTEQQQKAVTRATSQLLSRSPAAYVQEDSVLNTSRQMPLDTELNHTESDVTAPAKTKVRSSTSADDIALDTPLADYSELALARALLKHNLPIQLPTSYAPPHLSPPDGDMVVVGVRAQKLSSKKVCLWVRFISPPSLLGEQIQLYLKSFEPKIGSGQGRDLSLLTTLAHSRPHAKSLFDLGERSNTASSITLALIASFNSMEGGTSFSADELREYQTDEKCESSNPPGYSVNAPDPAPWPSHTQCT